MSVWTGDLPNEALWPGSTLETMAPFASVLTFDREVARKIAEMEKCPDLEPSEESMLQALRKWQADMWG